MHLCLCVCACVCACVWQPTPRTADVTVTKIAGYVRVRILMNRSFFWHSYFLRYGHFVEYMNMHAMNMWLTDASGRWLWGRIGLFTHGVTTMLGVSRQARSDTNLVDMINSCRIREAPVKTKSSCYHRRLLKYKAVLGLKYRTWLRWQCNNLPFMSYCGVRKTKSLHKTMTKIIEGSVTSWPS